MHWIEDDATGRKRKAVVVGDARGNMRSMSTPMIMALETRPLADFR
jgi:hypothetical protein